jgi:hypothetical protein
VRIRPLLVWLFMLSTPVLADEAKTIGAAIDATLAWQRSWFGNYFGEQCLKRAGEKHVAGYAHTFDQERTIGVDCRTRAPVKEKVVMFDATLDHVPLFFSGQLNPIPRADLSDGEMNARCSVSEDDLRRRAAAIKKDGTRFELSLTRLMQPVEHGSPQLRKFVKRTLASFYQGNNQPLPQPLVLGEFRNSDPYLIVAAGPNAHLVPMPTALQIRSLGQCGVVFDANRFSGRDSSASHATEAVPDLRRELERRGSRVEP